MASITASSGHFVHVPLDRYFLGHRWMMPCFMPALNRDIIGPRFPKSHEEVPTGLSMSSRPTRALGFTLLLLLTGLSPLVMTASADPSIHLSVDSSHVILEPGQSTNVTLTINNNGSSIESYNLSIDDSGLATYWDIVAVEATVDNVFPTWSENTTIIVRLGEGATTTDSGSFDITITEPDQNLSSSITVFLSVAPHHQPSLNPVDSSLATTLAGSNLTVNFTAENLGSVSDTFLLDVEVEPDLSGWWANQTNSSNGSNSTGNSSNGTNTTASLSVLMYGNSYTSANSLHTLVEDVVDSAGINGTVDANSGGGMNLGDHRQNIATSGNQWNTSLRGSDWDYVVLQDQSQIPSLPTNDTNWQASKSGAVDISTEVEAEGSETVLFMTWGHRSGESGPQWHQQNISQNYTIMQSRLTDGYLRYAENISAAGNTVWIAPVGLAFKTIHDGVEASGNNASQSGNLFYDLYTSDGSHPSLRGSYLAACVMFSTISGEVCAASNDSTSLPASVKLELQQAADDTVFNQTTGMSFYPWEVSGTSAFGMGASVPPGWNVQWNEDEVAHLAAGAEQTVALSVSVPENAVPDYYGFRLTIGSTNGNVTSSTLLVVQVEAENELSMSFTSHDDQFLPGQTTLTEVNVTNIGNGVLDINWVAGLFSAGLCQVALPAPQNLGVQPGDVVAVPMAITIQASASVGNSCSIMLAMESITQEIVPGSLLAFAIDVDELVDFSLTGPSTTVDLVPGQGVNYEVRINNNGSEEVTYFLDPVQHPNLTTSLVSASGVTVASGEVGVWTVNTNGPAGLLGLLQQEFTVTYGGEVASLSVDINVLEVPELAVTGPTDSRIIVRPGQSVVTPIEVFNSGTSNLELTASLLGLPANINAELSDVTIVLARGDSTTVNLTVSAALSAVASTNPFTITFEDGAIEAVLSIGLIVNDRQEVVINGVENLIYAHPLGEANLTVQVTNLGTASDTYIVELTAVQSNSWFTFSLSHLSFSLDAGETKTLIVSAREANQGALGGVAYSLNVTSTSTGEVGDTFAITVRSVVAGGTITLLGDTATAKPGSSVSGNIILTNTGSGEDTFTLSSIGEDCGLSTSVTLSPGVSSEALPWSCAVPEGAPAGLKSITFRAVSAMRSNVVINQAVGYQVEPSWPSDALVAVGLTESKVSLGMDSSTSTVITLQNLGNIEVTGQLDAIGADTGLLRMEWIRMSDGVSTNEYTLTPGSSAEFKLNLTSNVARSATATLTVKATSQGGNVLTTDESVSMAVQIEGPALPPNGLSLPLGVSVSQPATLTAMGLGWLIALLAVQLLRRSRRNDSEGTEDVGDEDEEDDEVKDLPELGFNECRLDEDNKVNCPECEARLGVPRGSQPPFRFTCPKCDNKIRVVE